MMRGAAVSILFGAVSAVPVGQGTWTEHVNKSLICTHAEYKGDPGHFDLPSYCLAEAQRHADVNYVVWSGTGGMANCHCYGITERGDPSTWKYVDSASSISWAGVGVLPPTPAPNGAVVDGAVSAAKSQQPPTQFDQCKGPVQSGLQYGIAGRTTPAGVNAPVNATESLAEAVCCDKRALLVAEPQFTYEAPDIQLIAKLNKSAVTIFYDSVCGLPLFKAPVGRSFSDFEADTKEHGWPSFRPEEVFTENVVTDKVSHGLVASKCGTHLGTYLPDAAGARWCIDLSCIAGNSK